MPTLLSDGTHYLTAPAADLEALLVTYCNSNGIASNAALRTAIDSIWSAASNPGCNVTALAYRRAELKAQIYIVP